MSETSRHGWVWAYKKLRRYKCSFLKSCFRATLYQAFDDTGEFKIAKTMLKIRLSRKRCKGMHGMGAKLWRPLCESSLAIPGRFIYTLAFRQKKLYGLYSLGYHLCGAFGSSINNAHRS